MRGYNATMSWPRHARMMIRLIGAVLVVLSLSTPALPMAVCVTSVCDSTCSMHAAPEKQSCCPDEELADKPSASECKCIMAPIERSTDSDLLPALPVYSPLIEGEVPVIPEPQWVDIASRKERFSYSDGSPPTVSGSPHAGRAPPSSRCLPLDLRA